MSIREQLAKSLVFLRGRKTDYQQVFSTPAGQRVLADLAVYCRAAETCGVAGNRDATFTLIGRNEVFLRIQHHLQLSPQQLLGLYDAVSLAKVAAGRGDDE